MARTKKRQCHNQQDTTKSRSAPKHKQHSLVNDWVPPTLHDGSDWLPPSNDSVLVDLRSYLADLCMHVQQSDVVVKKF